MPPDLPGASAAQSWSQERHSRQTKYYSQKCFSLVEPHNNSRGLLMVSGALSHRCQNHLCKRGCFSGHHSIVIIHSALWLLAQSLTDMKHNAGGMSGLTKLP